MYADAAMMKLKIIIAYGRWNKVARWRTMKYPTNSNQDKTGDRKQYPDNTRP